MPGRTYSAGSAYRYGFNGKENDNEVKGEGNQQDYGFRIYDPRISKFLSVDPLTNKYPFYTPYQFASNTPIMSIDIDGLESSNNPNFLESGFHSETPTTKYSPVCLVNQDYDLDPVTKFGIGMLKGPFYLFAAFTQTAGAAHYGDKIPKEKFAEEFLLIPNDNVVKDIVVPTLSWPAQLINDLRNDPTNPDLWGQAFGNIFLGKFTSSKIGVKAKIAERVTLANKLFSDQNIPINQLSGVDFLKGVQKTTLAEGTELIQWKEPGKSPNGFWYSLPGVEPSTLGIPNSYSVGHKIKLTSSVEVLKSVAGDIESWLKPGEVLQGGGKQFTTSKIEIGVNAELKGTINRAPK